MDFDFVFFIKALLMLLGLLGAAASFTAAIATANSSFVWLAIIGIVAVAAGLAID